jgi:hypothetical protein
MNLKEFAGVMNLQELLKDRNTRQLPAANVLVFRCSRVNRRQSIFNKTGRGRWFKQIRFSKACEIRKHFVRVYETGLDADWRYGALFFKTPIAGTETLGAPLVRPLYNPLTAADGEEEDWNLAHTAFDCGEAWAPFPTGTPGSQLPALEWQWLPSPGEAMPVTWCKSTKTLVFDRVAALSNTWLSMRGAAWNESAMVYQEKRPPPASSLSAVDKRIKLVTALAPVHSAKLATSLLLVHPKEWVATRQATPAQSNS